MHDRAQRKNCCSNEDGLKREKIQDQSSKNMSKPLLFEDCLIVFIHYATHCTYYLLEAIPGVDLERNVHFPPLFHR